MITNKQTNRVKQQDVNPLEFYSISNCKLTRPSFYRETQTNTTKTNGEYLLAGDTLGVNVGKNKEDNNKILMTLLNANDDELKDVSCFMTGIDKAVMDTFNSMYKAGNKIITKPQIARKVHGINGKPTDKQIESVEKSLIKLSKMKIKLDLSLLVNNRYKNIKVQEMTGKIVSLVKREAKNKKGVQSRNKQIVDGFSITDQPILCKVAEMLGQCTSINYELKKAALEKPLKSNERNIILFDYLIERIAPMKHNTMSKTIKYNTLTEEVLHREGQPLIDENNIIKQAKKRIKKNTRVILEKLKEEGYITDFTEYEKEKKYKKWIEINC